MGHTQVHSTSNSLVKGKDIFCSQLGPLAHTNQLKCEAPSSCLTHCLLELFIYLSFANNKTYRERMWNGER